MAKGGKNVDKADKAKTPELAAYVEKEPTELQVRFGEWIQEKTGYEPDLDTLKLAVFLRIPFQASPENQAVLEEKRKKNEAKAAKRAARAAAAEDAGDSDEPAEETPKTAKKSTGKAAGKAAAKAAPSDEDDSDDAGPTPAKPAGRRRAPAKTTAKGASPAEEAF